MSKLVAKQEFMLDPSEEHAGYWYVVKNVEKTDDDGESIVFQQYLHSDGSFHLSTYQPTNEGWKDTGWYATEEKAYEAIKQFEKQELGV